MSDFKTTQQLADLASSVNRYQEGYEQFCKIINEDQIKDLDEKQREKLNICFKSYLTKLRNGLQMLENYSGKRRAEGVEATEIGTLRKKFQDEIKAVCEIIIEQAKRQIDQMSVHNQANSAPRVFFQKILGDYHRYLCESYAHDSTLYDKYKEEARNFQKTGYELAVKTQISYHKQRLAIGLNQSILIYEILKESKEALSVANATFNEAQQEYASNADEKDADVDHIFYLLTENMRQWKSQD